MRKAAYPGICDPNRAASIVPAVQRRVVHSERRDFPSGWGSGVRVPSAPPFRPGSSPIRRAAFVVSGAGVGGPEQLRCRRSLGLPCLPVGLPLDRPSVALREDEVVVLPEGTGGDALLELGGSVGPARRARCGGCARPGSSWTKPCPATRCRTCSGPPGRCRRLGHLPDGVDELSARRDEPDRLGRAAVSPVLASRSR